MLPPAPLANYANLEHVKLADPPTHQKGGRG